ncbi:DUF2244 domain-containing protein [Aureimonas frigidaquae]|uniref:DUF2244 domain-containing protein n=1 Tax=Aureimonas frigidaquae TaxID=424757 RepID=UPI0007867880|nr:DUF2244 domain-containing protein [Aureimonas frigidaquae]
MTQEDGTNDNDRPFFTALLRPYRSLGPLGFAVTMLGFGALSLGTGLFFLSHGAWPVFGFFGLDVLALWLAFRASYRSARVSEEVSVSRTDLMIRKTSARGAVQEFHYNPFWTRFHVRRHQEFGVERMAVSARGQDTELGAFLNPDDRESFATAFTRALARARQ